MRRYSHPHKDRLDQLKAAEGSPQQRGLQFERLVSDVFRRAHYRVDRSAGAAQPRQTDLLATTDSETLLIECKWRHRRANSGDIDALRARLARIPGPATGVLISVNGFSRQAIDEVHRHRDQPILLFGIEELDEITDHWGDLRQMLGIKKQALRIDGNVHLLADGSPPRASGRPPAGPVTDADEFLTDATQPVPWIASPGGFGSFTFTRKITHEWSSRDAGIMLDVPLADLVRQDDLTWALAELASLGWTTGEGHWSLQQSATNWHGIGANTLVQAICERQVRYEGAGGIHRTEELTYYDHCEGGFYTLTADLDSKSGDVRHAELSIRLVGIPFDRKPLDELCRTFEVLAPLFFRPFDPDIALDGSLAMPAKLSVRAVGLVLHEDLDDPHAAHWVCGIVAVSPLKSLKPEHAEALRDLPAALYETDLILCDLRNWHPLSEDHDYYLDWCQWTQTSTATVARLVVDWSSDQKGATRANDDSAI